MALVDFIFYTNSSIIFYSNYFCNSFYFYIYKMKSNYFYSEYIYYKIFYNKNNVSFAFKSNFQIINFLNKNVKEFEIKLFFIFAHF